MGNREISCGVMISKELPLSLLQLLFCYLDACLRLPFSL